MSQRHLELQPTRVGQHVYRDVRLNVGRYEHGGGLAVTLECNEEGYWEPLATLTVNVPGDPRPGPKVWARDSEENAGIVDSLEAQGLVRRTGNRTPSGWIELHEVELLGPLREALEVAR